MPFIRVNFFIISASLILENVSNSNAPVLTASVNELMYAISIVPEHKSSKREYIFVPALWKAFVQQSHVPKSIVIFIRLIGNGSN